MGKKKLVPEYTFSLGKEDDIRQSTIKNIFDKIADSEKASIARINSVRLSNSAANLSFEDVARNFIRKNINDTVTGELSFTRGIRSANHSSGVGGVGYRLFNDEKGDGILEVDSVKVRKTLSTNYLTYDKVNAVGGTIVLSSAWMTVDKVEVYTDRIKCYFKNEGLNVQTWKENDQAKMQRGLDKYLMTVVTDVSQTQDSDGYHWVELYFGDNSEFIDGASIPEVGDVFVQWGSRDDAHPERKNIIIMSVGDSANEYPYIEQYKGVDSFDISNKLVSRVSNDVYFGSHDKSKYIWWNKDDSGEMLIKGILNVSESDDKYPITTYRGVWDENDVYYRGDIVTYEGAVYIMISGTPTGGTPPSPGVTWEVYLSGGAQGDVGQTIRYTSWVVGATYFAGNKNDGGTNNNPNRIVDYVTHVGYDGVLRAYKCILYHTSEMWNSPENDEYDYWQQISYIPAIASDVILAKSASIGGFIFSAAVDASGNSVPISQQEMRTSDNSMVLRGDGSGHLADRNIEWDTIGRLTLKAFIEATGGKIGGLNIFSNSLSSPSMKFSETPVENLASLLSPSQVNISEQASWYDALNGYAYTQNIVLPYDAQLSFRVDTSTDGFDARYDVIIETLSGNIIFRSRGDGTLSNEPYIVNLPLGTYIIKAYQYSVLNIPLIPSKSVRIKGYTVDNTITASGYVIQTKIGNDGFYSFWSNIMYMYFSASHGLETKCDNKFMSSNGVYGLRVTNSGIEKTLDSGVTWTAI